MFAYIFAGLGSVLTVDPPCETHYFLVASYEEFSGQFAHRLVRRLKYGKCLGQLTQLILSKKGLSAGHY